VRDCVVVADWDSDAQVWVATSDDIPGLVTEAASEEQLVTKLRAIVPQLLELNSGLLKDSDCSGEFVIHYNRDERVRLYA